MLKALKWLVATLVALIAILWLGGYLLSPKFSVTRSVSIAAPSERIYGLIADPRQWKQWSVWHVRDPAMALTYSGPPAGAGAAWEWKSKSEGDGKMTFTAAEPNQRLAYDLYFPDFGTTSAGELKLTPQGNAVQVSWVMNGDMGSNPLYRWIALFADGMVGKDFAAGLKNLKAVAEKP